MHGTPGAPVSAVTIATTQQESPPLPACLFLGSVTRRPPTVGVLLLAQLGRATGCRFLLIIPTCDIGWLKEQSCLPFPT